MGRNADDREAIGRVNRSQRGLQAGHVGSEAKSTVANGQRGKGIDGLDFDVVLLGLL